VPLQSSDIEAAHTRDGAIEAAHTRDGAPASASWEALGTSVVLRVTEAAALDRARVRVERELDAIDRACSRFRVDSELARVNAGAGRPVRVGALFMEALALALRAAELTEGDVDPTVGRALELAGYDRDWRLLAQSLADAPARAGHGVPAELEIGVATAENGAAGVEDERPVVVSARRSAGWRTIAVDRGGAWVSVPRGIRLDFGATAKAWAADRAAWAAAKASGCGALVSVGGDIATCGSAPAQGWRIRVSDDHRNRPTAPGQTVSIASGGLATSSTAVRRWIHGGRTMHHIIDPRTGEPTQACWRTVSVAAASCAEANIATTAALVKGVAAAGWLQERCLPARLVDHEGRVLYVGDWPRPKGGAR
jgi:FAD:protein FMN transferase